MGISEREAVRTWYRAGNSLLTRAREALARGDKAMAQRLAEWAFRGLPEPLRQEAVLDVVYAPVMDEPGLSVRVWRMCRRCEGTGSVFTRPDIEAVAHLMDPEMVGDWLATCPECRGDAWTLVDEF